MHWDLVMKLKMPKSVWIYRCCRYGEYNNFRDCLKFVMPFPILMLWNTLARTVKFACCSGTFLDSSKHSTFGPYFSENYEGMQNNLCCDHTVWVNVRHNAITIYGRAVNYERGMTKLHSTQWAHYLLFLPWDVKIRDEDEASVKIQWYRVFLCLLFYQNGNKTFMV